MEKPKCVDGLLGPYDLSTELWREYVFPGGQVYTIPAPRWLYVGETTHRVIDSSGVTHCLPRSVPLRWFAPDEPVSF